MFWKNRVVLVDIKRIRKNRIYQQNPPLAPPRRGTDTDAVFNFSNTPKHFLQYAFEYLKYRL